MNSPRCNASQNGCITSGSIRSLNTTIYALRSSRLRGGILGGAPDAFSASAPRASAPTAPANQLSEPSTPDPGDPPVAITARTQGSISGRQHAESLRVDVTMAGRPARRPALDATAIA